MAKNKGDKGKAETYAAPKKGSGKPKYQNVIKSERVNTKEPRKEPIRNVSKVLKSLGTKTTKQEVTRKAGKSPNIAKQIDREEKVRKGVRTEKPSTPKVPVKPRGGMRPGGMGLGGGGGLNKANRYVIVLSPVIRSSIVIS